MNETRNCPRCGTTMKLIGVSRKEPLGWVAPTDQAAPLVDVPRERNECRECGYRSLDRRPRRAPA